MKTRYFYSFLLVIFATFVLFIVAVAEIYRTSDDKSRLPPKPILLAQTFDDVEWLAKTGIGEISTKIEDKTEREQFIRHAKSLEKHLALEDAITGKLSSSEILDLKRELCELYKVASKQQDKAAKGKKMYFTQYINKIKELDQKIEILEMMAI